MRQQDLGSTWLLVKLLPDEERPALRGYIAVPTVRIHSASWDLWLYVLTERSLERAASYAYAFRSKEGRGGMRWGTGAVVRDGERGGFGTGEQREHSYAVYTPLAPFSFFNRSDRKLTCRVVCEHGTGWRAM